MRDLHGFAGAIVVFVWLSVAIGFTGCGDDDDEADVDRPDDDDDNDDDNDTSPPDDDDDDDDDNDDATPPPGCDTLQQGWNGDYLVNGVARSFFLDLPEGVADSWPWPVVFSWHGFGDSAANFRGLIDWLVDNDDLPFIGVTIEDTGMLFDWDIINGAGEENRELLLFDALLEELDTCWGVDRDHVHVMGFSFGGGIADLMGVRRGDQIASIATCSGVYGSNPANVIPYTVANWPELTTENQYVELRLHGGILDNMILPFGAYGVNDRKYLNRRGHDVIECVHPFIHNMGFLYMGPETFIEFFADHPLGTHESAYAAGMPADYPENCTYRPKD